MKSFENPNINNRNYDDMCSPLPEMSLKETMSPFMKSELEALSKSPSSVSSIFDRPFSNRLCKTTVKDEATFYVAAKCHRTMESNFIFQEKIHDVEDRRDESQILRREEQDSLDEEKQELSPSHPLKIISSIQQSLRDSWDGHRRTTLERAKSGIFERAREDSLRGWTPEEVASRRRSFAAVGDIGLTLFRPVDSFFFDVSHSGNDISPEILSKRRESLRSLENVVDVGNSEQNETKNTNHEDGDHEDDDFGPVQVAPESTEDLVFSPLILSYNTMTELSKWGLPTTIMGKRWKRLYSVARDGDDFGTFLQKVRGHNATILVVRTDSDEIIGGFADAQWERLRTGHDGSSYFGTGGSFLFRVENSSKSTVRRTRTCSAPELPFSEVNDGFGPRPPSSSPPSYMTMKKRHAFIQEAEVHYESDNYNDDDNQENNMREFLPLSFSPSRRYLSQPGIVKVYRWSGKNHYNQLCHTGMGKLAMGGGGIGCSFGLCIQDNFTRGSSGPCDTYGTTEPLTKKGDHFEVMDFEVYGFEHGWD